MKHRSHDDAMAEVYQKDPAYALELLNSVLADGDQAELLVVCANLPRRLAECKPLQIKHISIPRKFTERSLPMATRRSAVFGRFLMPWACAWPLSRKFPIWHLGDHGRSRVTLHKAIPDGD